MSKKAQQVMARYEKGYVTDAQLKRYLELEAITEEEYDVIYKKKHSSQNKIEE